MSDEAGARHRRRVLALQLRVWGIGVIALIIGVVVWLVPWIITGRLKISWTLSGSEIIALVTLGGILATAIGTVVLA